MSISELCSLCIPLPRDTFSIITDASGLGMGALRQNIHLDKVLESRDPLGLASCITSYCSLGVTGPGPRTIERCHVVLLFVVPTQEVARSI